MTTRWPAFYGSGVSPERYVKDIDDDTWSMFDVLQNHYGYDNVDHLLDEDDDLNWVKADEDSFYPRDDRYQQSVDVANNIRTKVKNAYAAHAARQMSEESNSMDKQARAFTQQCFAPAFDFGRPDRTYLSHQFGETQSSVPLKWTTDAAVAVQFGYGPLNLEPTPPKLPRYFSPDDVAEAYRNGHPPLQYQRAKELNNRLIENEEDEISPEEAEEVRRQLAAIGGGATPRDPVEWPEDVDSDPNLRDWARMQRMLSHQFGETQFAAPGGEFSRYIDESQDSPDWHEWLVRNGYGVQDDENPDAEYDPTGLNEDMFDDMLQRPEDVIPGEGREEPLPTVPPYSDMSHYRFGRYWKSPIHGRVGQPSLSMLSSLWRYPKETYQRTIGDYNAPPPRHEVRRSRLA